MILEARVLEFAATLPHPEKPNLITVKLFVKLFGANNSSKGIKVSLSDIIFKLKTALESKIFGSGTF